MRLTLQSDYALRMLTHLAANEDRLCTIAEVARRFDISKAHLMKVAHLLGRHGFIKTERGRGGGLRLATAPDEISVGDVVRCMEADFAVVECFQGAANCCLISPACRLKGVLAEAVEAFLAVLDRTTLAALVKDNAELGRLLAIEEAA